MVAALAGIRIGGVVGFEDRSGRRREAMVLAVDGPLLHVEYRLASGQLRTAWIDILGVEGPPGLG